MSNEERDLSKEWSSVDDGDRNAILGSIRGHIRHSADRKKALERQFPEGVSEALLKAFVDRTRAAEIALAILGEEAE